MLSWPGQLPPEQSKFTTRPEHAILSPSKLAHGPDKPSWPGPTPPPPIRGLGSWTPLCGVCARSTRRRVPWCVAGPRAFLERKGTPCLLRGYAPSSCPADCESFFFSPVLPVFEGSMMGVNQSAGLSHRTKSQSPIASNPRKSPHIPSDTSNLLEFPPDERLWRCLIPGIDAEGRAGGVPVRPPDPRARPFPTRGPFVLRAGGCNVLFDAFVTRPKKAQGISKMRVSGSVRFSDNYRGK